MAAATPPWFQTPAASAGLAPRAAGLPPDPNRLPNLQIPAYSGVQLPTATNAAPTPGQAQPYFTPQDIVGYADHNFNNQQAFSNAAYNLQSTQGNADQQRYQIDNQARLGSRDANDDAAGRGLSNSSIRDGNLNTIEANRQQAQLGVDSNVGVAQAFFNNILGGLQANDQAYSTALPGIAIGNADAINKTYVPPDPQAAAAPAAKPAPQAQAAAANPTGSGMTAYGHPMATQQPNQFKQTQGPRAGQTYSVVKKNGGTYRQYQDGTVIRIG